MTKPDRDTVRITLDSRDRALPIVRSLIRSKYFGPEIPSASEISRLLHLPLPAIRLALDFLVTTKLIQHSGNPQAYSYGPWFQETRSGQIAFVLNLDLIRGWYSTFQEYFIGFEQTMADENYEVIVASHFKTTGDKQQALSALRANGTMGFAFASDLEPEILQFVAEQKIPSVLLGNALLRQEAIGCVCSDNRGGIRKVMDHLFKLNHRRIAFYGTNLLRHEGFSERYHSYQQEMRNADFQPNSALVQMDVHDESSSRKAAETFSLLQEMPTAIVCATDRDAFELLSEFRRIGIVVPEQVSLVGFDNNHHGQIIDPAISSVEIYSDQMGRVAANYLLNEMIYPQLPVHIEVPTLLVPRNSVRSLMPLEEQKPPVTAR